MLGTTVNSKSAIQEAEEAWRDAIRSAERARSLHLDSGHVAYLDSNVDSLRRSYYALAGIKPTTEQTPQPKTTTRSNDMPLTTHSPDAVKAALIRARAALADDIKRAPARQLAVANAFIAGKGGDTAEQLTDIIVGLRLLEAEVEYSEIRQKIKAGVTARQEADPATSLRSLYARKADLEIKHPGIEARFLEACNS